MIWDCINLVLFVPYEIVMSLLNKDLIRLLSIPLELFYIGMSYAGDGYRAYKQFSISMDHPFNLSIPGPMMLCVSAHGYESKAQRGLIRYSDSGSDDDGEGETDHTAGLYQLDQSTHEDKSAWNQVLEKYAQLSARLDQLEATECLERSG